MFTSKGLFSSISCPYKDSCLLPKCLFRHQEPAALSETNGSKKTNLDQDYRSQQQLGIFGAAVENIKTEAGPPARAKSDSDAIGLVPSVHREISPPPLRRTAPPAQKDTAKQDSKTPISKHKTPVKKAVKALKAEVLNPRMVKSSPASHDLRFRLLKALYTELKRLNDELNRNISASEKSLVLLDQALISMALDVEETAAIEKPSIYSNVVKNKILSYKRMSVKDWKEERAKGDSKKQAVDAMVPSSLTPLGPPNPIETGLSLEDELVLLSKLYTPINDLAKYGYVSKAPTGEGIQSARDGIAAAKGWEVCDRCKTRFQVFPGRREDGAITSGGDCIYHWGKSYMQEKSDKDPRAKRDRKYTCCGQLIGDSAGCTTGECHVFKVTEVKRLASLLNFEMTPENPVYSSRPLCIDGEMGYTVHGLELIRLTATAWPGGEELLDVLVRPFGEILDLNSRFSGIWPQQMADALPWRDRTDGGTSTINGPNVPLPGELRIVESPDVARTLLFRLLDLRTPIIGHGLENDLNAVRIIHPTIVDTALLFPHKAGLPFRNGLKSLMFIHLQRHIQVVDTSKIRGHDSKEDARAAGDLVRYKIGTEWEKMKREGWSLEDGKLINPKGIREGTARTRPTVEFLKRGMTSNYAGKGSDDGSQMDAVKAGIKRSLAEISRDSQETSDEDQ